MVFALGGMEAPVKLYPPLQAVRLSSNTVDIASARASRAKRFMVVLSDVV